MLLHQTFIKVKKDFSHESSFDGKSMLLSCIFNRPFAPKLLGISHTSALEAHNLGKSQQNIVDFFSNSSTDFQLSECANSFDV